MATKKQQTSDGYMFKGLDSVQPTNHQKPIHKAPNYVDPNAKPIKKKTPKSPNSKVILPVPKGDALV
jgi:hypothetical protein